MCQPTSEDIKQHNSNSIIYNVSVHVTCWQERVDRADSECFEVILIN